MEMAFWQELASGLSDLYQMYEGFGNMEASQGVYTAVGVWMGWLGWLAAWENGEGTVVDGVWGGCGVPTMGGVLFLVFHFACSSLY